MMKLLSIIFLCLCQSSHGDKISIAGQEELFKAEQNVVNLLDNMLNLIEEEINKLDDFIINYRPIMNQHIDLNTLLSHPLNDYHILKKFVLDWKTVEDMRSVMTNTIVDSFNDIISYRQKLGFPDLDRLEATAQSLVIAQEMYGLDVEALSEGKLQDIRDQRKDFQGLWSLSRDDCVFLGDNAVELNKYKSALAFYNEAFKKSSRETSHTDEEIQELLQNVTEKFHNFTLIKEELGKKNPTKYEEIQETKKRVSKLCRGDVLLAEKIRSTLSCRYLSNGSPYLLLGPMKLEEVSLDPYIVMLHEFMLESEIEFFKEYATPKLTISLVFNVKGKAPKAELTHRASDQAWLNSSNISDKVTKRIGAVTGLETMKRFSTEEHQIANYGMGGQFKAHPDYLQQLPYFETFDTEKKGDRIATMMTYLSDVEVGGATVFPKANVTLWPKKGSASFWWNLKRSGEPDILSQHAGCPVLLGSKWITNKWIRANNQMWKAPCDLNQHTRFDAAFWGY